MSMKATRDKRPGRFWRFLTMLFGEPPELKEARLTIAELQLQLQEATEAREESNLSIKKLQAELETTRDERLSWRAKEASTRKDLMDSQERNKELLEQVVQLTHQQRQAKQSLLDQKFKTEATPLERNRFEADMTEARSRVKEAEARVRKAEEKAARLKKLEKQARRVKGLESKLAWETQQTRAHVAALRATLEKVRELEGPGASNIAKPAAKRLTVKKHTYRKPSIRLSKPKARKKTARKKPARTKSR